MSTLEDFIHSGILEMYVLGCLSPEETEEVEAAMMRHPQVMNEIAEISRAIEHKALEHAVEPNATIRPFLLATINYIERIKRGGEAAFPPELTPESTPEEYALWINREDMTVSSDFEDIHLKIIGYTPKMTTAIAWIRHIAPHEVHTREYEKFLVLEGTCEIILRGEVYPLKAGDYFAVPLYETHIVEVTSEIPCKLLLQRKAV